MPIIYAPLVDLHQVAPGLWRWTAPHPEWEQPEQEDSPADWPREVGCIAYAAPSTLVLIDPLVTDGDYYALDELTATKEHVAILITIAWHERSRGELMKRYNASVDVPEGVEAIEIAGSRETVFWIPEHAALVPGDRILGDRPPGLRLCPDSWMRQPRRLQTGRPSRSAHASARPSDRDWCSSRTASPCSVTDTPRSSVRSHERRRVRRA